MNPLRRIRATLPKNKMGHLEIPLLWPWHWRWLCRSPWWVAMPVVMVWCPIGLLLHLPVMAMWWEEERAKQRERRKLP